MELELWAALAEHASASREVQKDSWEKSRGREGRGPEGQEDPLRAEALLASTAARSPAVKGFYSCCNKFPGVRLTGSLRCAPRGAGP